MNIPQDTLQAVADAAFNAQSILYLARDPINDESQDDCPRAVIQHALNNPALAPFLAGGIGEYTDEEIGIAFDKVPMIAQANTLDLLRAFLAALPRRESPALAEALAEAIARAEKAENLVTELENKLAEIAAGCDIQRGDLLYRQSLVVIGTGKTADAIRAEKAEAKAAELQAWKDSAMEVEREWDAQAIAKSLGAIPGQSCRRVIAKRVPELLAELAARPQAAEIAKLKTERDNWEADALRYCKNAEFWQAERDKTLAEIAEYKVRVDQLHDTISNLKAELSALKSAQLGILRPLAEMPETVPDGCIVVRGWQLKDKSWALGTTSSKADTHFAILRLPAAEATPPAAPEPAAQVPLGPEDVKPGAIVTDSADSWYKVKYVTSGGVRIDIQGSNLIDYEELKTDGWSINTSIPDTGRWDANAWRPCSKPGK